MLGSESLCQSADVSLRRTRRRSTGRRCRWLVRRTRNVVEPKRTRKLLALQSAVQVGSTGRLVSVGGLGPEARDSGVHGGCDLVDFNAMNQVNE
jgi:hypothetical protein